MHQPTATYTTKISPMKPYDTSRFLAISRGTRTLMIPDQPVSFTTAIKITLALVCVCGAGASVDQASEVVAENASHLMNQCVQRERAASAAFGDVTHQGGPLNA